MINKLGEYQVVGKRAHVTKIIRESKKATRERGVKTPGVGPANGEMDLEKDLPTHLLT